MQACQKAKSLCIVHHMGLQPEGILPVITFPFSLLPPWFLGVILVLFLLYKELFLKKKKSKRLHYH